METIRKGYKQTDIGIIPEDWEVLSIKEFTEIVTGGTPSTLISEYWGGDIFWMNSGELNHKYIHDVVGRITRLGLECSSTRIIPPYCVLIGLAGQGRTRGTAAINFVELCTNQSIAAILPSPTHSSIFLYHFINKKYFELRELSTGDGGRGGLNKKILENFYVPHPKIEEQRAIAEVLSDIDSLIEVLNKKIAKKRAIKDGAMQQLLTAKRRLPYFSQPWEEIKLGDVLTIKKGQMLTSGSYQAGDVPVIAGGKTPAGYHLIANRDNNTITISASGANAGYVAFFSTPIFATDCSTISESDKYHVKYIYYLLCLYQDLIYKSQTGGAQPHINAKDIYPIEVLYSENLDEQQAIAEILTDMDAEIELLEQQRTKYTTLKQGAMQQLLTGQIRLKTK